MAEILLLADLHLSANTPTFNHLIMKLKLFLKDFFFLNFFQNNI